ncbi:MAG: efflux RND transporter periplasmic adaptor subunit [Treponema sp.]
MKLKRKTFMTLVIIAAVVLVTAVCVLIIAKSPKKTLGAAGGKRGGRPASTATVKTAVCGIETLQDYVLTNGEVESQSAVAVYPSMSGKIAQVNVTLGSQVRKGQVIAKVDPSEPGTRYALSPVEAPISGSVLTIPGKIGTTVSTNTEITMIGDIENLQISAAIPERYVSELKTGLKAEISLQSYPGVVFEAVIKRVSPVVDKASRTKEVILDFTKKDSRINAGMFAKVKLFTSAYPGKIVVPVDAVVSDDVDSYVFVVDENAVASKRTVKTGKSVDAKIQIVEGLAEGERIVVEGMLSVSDGAQVNDISRPNELRESGEGSEARENRGNKDSGNPGESRELREK